jgi:hypothetical protein
MDKHTCLHPGCKLQFKYKQSLDRHVLRDHVAPAYEPSPVTGPKTKTNLLEPEHIILQQEDFDDADFFDDDNEEGQADQSIDENDAADANEQSFVHDAISSLSLQQPQSFAQPESRPSQAADHNGPERSFPELSQDSNSKEYWKNIKRTQFYCTTFSGFFFFFFFSCQCADLHKNRISAEPSDLNAIEQLTLEAFQFISSEPSAVDTYEARFIYSSSPYSADSLTLLCDAVDSKTYKF